MSAFQSSAFQSSAFQVAIVQVVPPVTPGTTNGGGGSVGGRGPLPTPAWSYSAPQKKARSVTKAAARTEAQEPARVENRVLSRVDADALMARLREGRGEMAALARMAYQAKEQETERQRALMRAAMQADDDEMAVINAVCLAMTRH